MNIDNQDALLMKIVRLIDEMNSVSLRISNADIFGKQLLLKPKLMPPELGFLRAVSWFYILYREAGKVNVHFLQNQLSAYNLDPENCVPTYLDNVRVIRTYLQHNLNLEVKKGRETQEACEQWFEKHCRTRVPVDDEQWGMCLIALLQETILCLTLLKNCIRFIEQDESREEIVAIWNLRRRRYHPPEEFDELIILIAADFGRTNFNVVQFRKRYYDKWNLELQYHDDFSTEARKLIENALLSEAAKRLPITGKDVMQELNVSPSQQLEEIMQRAKLLYEKEPCSREQLLEKLHQEMSLQQH